MATSDSVPTQPYDTAFAHHRPRLLSLAHRLLGSVHDAEDAVQTAWLRLASASDRDIDNVAAYLTRTVTTVCLDHLRDRRRRDLLRRRVGAIAVSDAFAAHAADEAFLRREAVSRALMVLLARLTPAQRVAFVLHDLFAVPFDQIAEILAVTTPSAKKHASRARARLRPGEDVGIPDGTADGEVVDAFLRAAAGGDLRHMLALMAPECVRVADPQLLPVGTATTVSGAEAVADETRRFAERIRCSVPMRVDGREVHLIAPGGHPLAVIDVHVSDGAVDRVTIRAVRDNEVLEPAARSLRP